MTKSTYGVPLDGTGRVVMADRARLRERGEYMVNYGNSDEITLGENVLALLDALKQAEGELGRARDVLGLLAASQWNVARS